MSLTLPQVSTLAPTVPKQNNSVGHSQLPLARRKTYLRWNLLGDLGRFYRAKGRAMEEEEPQPSPTMNF